MPTKILIILSALLLASGCGVSKPRTQIEFVPKEIVVTKYIPVPQSLLKQHCSDLVPSDSVTQKQLEAAFVRAWLCVMDHNADKAEIEGLK